MLKRLMPRWPEADWKAVQPFPFAAARGAFAGMTSSEGRIVLRYFQRPDGLIGIVSTSHCGSPEGRVRVATGRAKIVPGSGNAKLRLSLFGPLFWGHYWVLDHDGEYGWAVVGEPSGKYLWLLTREAVPGRDVQELLVARARALGFDTYRLHRTLQ